MNISATLLPVLTLLLGAAMHVAPSAVSLAGLYTSPAKQVLAVVYALHITEHFRQFRSVIGASVTFQV